MDGGAFDAGGAPLSAPVAPDAGARGALLPVTGALANGALASIPGEPANNTTEKDNAMYKFNAQTMPHFNNAANNLQIIIKNEDNKLVNEEIKVFIAYKCHACGQCGERPEFVLQHMKICAPTAKNVKLYCGCGLIFDVQKENFANHCELHRQFAVYSANEIANERNVVVNGIAGRNTEDSEIASIIESAEKLSVLENTGTEDQGKTSVESLVEDRITDRDDTENGTVNHETNDAVDINESGVEGTESKLMIESPNTTSNDHNINDNDVDLVNISSPDEVILTTGEDKNELFKAHCIMFAFDYGSYTWRGRGEGEVKILYHPERKNYWLQFRRCQYTVYQPLFTMTLKAGLKLQRMRSHSDHAWEWTFHYVTKCGTGAFQTLAARFRSQESAEEFYSKVKECLVMQKKNACVRGPKKDLISLSASSPIRPLVWPPTFGTFSPISGAVSPVSGASSPTCSVTSVIFGATSPLPPIGAGSSGLGADWSTPTLAAFGDRARNVSERKRYNHEEYQLQRLARNPEAARQSNGIRTSSDRVEIKIKHEDDKKADESVAEDDSAGEAKVSLVYKCQACGLSFDRPKRLLEEHLNNCTPGATIIKTKCICGLIFDKFNFPYHSSIHRQFTKLDVKKIIVGDDVNIDVSGMKTEFMDGPHKGSDTNNTVAESPVETEHVERKETVGNIGEMLNDELKMEDSEVVTEHTATDMPVVKKDASLVYKCRCRLCFDEAESLLKHLQSCSPAARVVKTTCICGLVFDHSNFEYHCEVHRQFKMLNVKEIIVRNEGPIDISRMKEEFLEHDEIKVDEIADQGENLTNSPVVEETFGQETEGKTEHQTVSAAAENNSAVSEESKINRTIAVQTENSDDIPSPTKENNDLNEEVTESEENKMVKSQEALCDATNEIAVSAEPSNEELAESPKLTKAEITDNNNSANEENHQGCSDTDPIDSDKETGDLTELTMVKDQETAFTAADKAEQGENITADAKETEDIVENPSTKDEDFEKNNEKIELQENETDENQQILTIETEKITVTIEQSNGEELKLSDNSETQDEIMNIIAVSEKNKTYRTIAAQTENSAGNLSTTDGNNSLNEEVIELQENKTDESRETLNNATNKIAVTAAPSNEESSESPNNSEPHGELNNKSDHINNETGPDLVKLIKDEIIDHNNTASEVNHQGQSETDLIDSDKETGDETELKLVKDESHEEETIVKRIETEDETAPQESAFTAADKAEEGKNNEENETINAQEIEETIKKPSTDQDNTKTKEIIESQENETKVSAKITAAVQLINGEEPELSENSGAQDKMINNSNHPNNEKVSDSVKSMKDDTIDDNSSIIEESHQGDTESDVVDSDKKTDNITKEKNVKNENHDNIKDENHVDNITEINKTAENPDQHQKASATVNKNESDANSKENNTMKPKINCPETQENASKTQNGANATNLKTEPKKQNSENTSTNPKKKANKKKKGKK